MPGRLRRQDIAVERSRAIRNEIGRSLRDARLDRDLSLRSIAAATGISAPVGSRIERGVLESVTFEQVMRMGAAVGLDLAARLYPAGEPIRDAPHRALLERLRRRLNPLLTMLTEVPLPLAGDLRAWDAIVRGLGWHLPVETETRPRDAQALDRRIALKLRDSGFGELILLLLNSAHNRTLVASAALGARYAIDGRTALARLSEGRHPGGSAIVLL